MLGKKKWLLFIFLILSIESLAFLKIDLDPRFIEMSGGNQTTEEVTVFNRTNEFVRYKISFEKPKGLKEKYYIGEKLMIYPRVISLKPKGHQVIRLRLKTPIKAEENDYVAKLCFDELTPKKLDNGENATIKDDVNIDIQFKVKLEMYVLVTSELTPPLINLKETKVDERDYQGKKMRYLVFKTKNNGERFFKPRAKIEMLEGTNKLSTDNKVFGMMIQGEERDLKVDVTNFSIGDKLRVKIFDAREPKKIIFQKDIEI